MRKKKIKRQFVKEGFRGNQKHQPKKNEIPEVEIGFGKEAPIKNKKKNGFLLWRKMDIETGVSICTPSLHFHLFLCDEHLTMLFFLKCSLFSPFKYFSVFRSCFFEIF